MATSKRVYLPRGTVDYSVLRTIYQHAEKNKLTFGKALEKMLIESQTFNNTMQTLGDNSPWFKQDTADFLKDINS